MDRDFINKKRDAAFQIKLDKEGGNIMDFMPLGNILYVIRTESIYEIKTPDAIDPERKYPNTKAITRKVIGYGTKDSLVYKTLGLAKKLLNNVILEDNSKKDVILNSYFELLKHIVHLYELYQRLINEFLKKGKAYDLLIETSKYDFLPDIPQIDELEPSIKDFIFSFHKAQKVLLSFFRKMYEDKIGAFTNLDSFVDRYSQYYGENSEWANTIRTDDIPWWKETWQIRNCLEHPENEVTYIKIYNIEPAPNNKIMPPSYKYKIKLDNNYKETEQIDLLRDIEVYLYNIIDFSKEALLYAIKDNCDRNFEWTIYKIAESRIDPDYPCEYEILPNMSKFEEMIKNAENKTSI